MTDATLSTTVAAPIAEVKATPRYGYRAATSADLDLVHLELMKVIDESPHYNAEFKTFEKSRLTKTYLRALQRQDPFHIICLLSEGKIGGALISGPELGAVFRYWSWIFPEYRQTRLGMHGMRIFDEHFDNGRFHKAYTFVRPENEVALALLGRYGYEVTCVLKNHIFGQDYCVVERPYTKLTLDYDTGMGAGHVGRIIQAVNTLLGR
jgi:RimJ/RimL family protein N-acetyltransferase